MFVLKASDTEVTLVAILNECEIVVWRPCCSFGFRAHSEVAIVIYVIVKIHLVAPERKSHSYPHRNYLLCRWSVGHLPSTQTIS